MIHQDKLHLCPIYTYKKQHGAHEPECKHVCQSTVYRKRHSRSIFFTLRHGAGHHALRTSPPSSVAVMKGLRFCIQIKHWRKGCGRSTSRKKQWHVPKSREKKALENSNRPHNTEKTATAASGLLVNRSARPCVVASHLYQQEVYESHTKRK